MDGRGIVAAEALGASGVQLGTAFLTCREAGIPDAYKAAIRTTRDDATAVTRAFSGRPARGIVNPFMAEVEASADAILPFPLQNSATRPMLNAAAAQGDTRYLSLWAGQGAPLARETTAAELVAALVREAAEVREKLVGS
jgi:nitronate monooxygenase